LIWYIQPQILYDGVTKYGQNTGLIFDSMRYFQNEIITTQTLTFNQLEVILKNVDNDYYNTFQSLKYLNNELVSGIFYISFCLYPEETQPSGTINLRQIKGKQYSVRLSKSFLNEYFNSNLNLNKKGLILKFFAKCYDMFIVHKGNSKLMFNK
jgi:hypothetical protein